MDVQLPTRTVLELTDLLITVADIIAIMSNPRLR